MHQNQSRSVVAPLAISMWLGQQIPPRFALRNDTELKDSIEWNIN